MINASQLFVLLVCGCALIVFGLVPGVVQSVINGVRNFRDSLASPSFTPRQHVEIEQPAWLAIAGALMIALGIVAYTLR